MQCRVFIFHKNRGKISSFFGFYEEIIPRIWPKGFCALFVRNHQALRLSVACLDEIDAVLVLGGRDNQLCFIGEEGFDFLSQCVVKAYFAKVFALEGHAFVGRVGEQSQCCAVLIEANSGFIDDVDFKIARRGVDVHFSFKRLSYRHIDINFHSGGLASSNSHAFGDILTFIHAVHRKDGVGGEGVDGHFFSGHVGNGQLAGLVGLAVVVDVHGLRIDGQRASAVVRLQAVLLHGVHHILGRERIEIQQASDGDAAVGHDEDERGAGLDAVKVEDLVAAAVLPDGGELYAIFVGPLLAGGIAVDVRNLDVEHIVHVAAHLGIGTRNVGRNHLALAASVEEEVDEDGLASVEDFEEVVGLPVAVGDGEVNGLRERGLLCAKACAKEQERE